MKEDVRPTRGGADLRALTDALPVLIAHVGDDLSYRYVNRTYQHWFGRNPDDLIGRSVSEVLGAENFEKLRPNIEAALAGEARFSEQQIAFADGETRYVRIDHLPGPDAGGRQDGYFALIRDISEEKERERRLAVSEERMRTVLDSITDGFCAFDTEWRFTVYNHAAARHFGKSPQEVIGRSLYELFPMTGGTPIEDGLRRAMEEGESSRFVTESAVRPGCFVEMRIAPKRSGGGVACAFTDITERRLAESQRELLVNELNHRVKNTLAVVQSMAAQTFNDDRVPAETRAAFEGRLLALAAAHGLLTQENWQSAPLERIVEDAVGPFGAGRFTIRAPDLRLAPKAAVTFSLALHELATNAAKYGALSRHGGRVEIEAGIADGTAKPRFRFSWHEKDGPEVVQPDRKGFGSRLLQRGLAGELGAQVTLDYKTGGLECAIEAPLENVVQE